MLRTEVGDFVLRRVESHACQLAVVIDERLDERFRAGNPASSCAADGMSGIVVRRCPHRCGEPGGDVCAVQFRVSFTIVIDRPVDRASALRIAGAIRVALVPQGRGF
ncbi:MAG TPA: hypothetical protein VM847_08450 [Tahibacter sp.]|nr:hypothetical protein [Tahibacter sp.]